MWVSQKQEKDTGLIYSYPMWPLEGNTVASLTKILNSIRNYSYVNCKHNIHVSICTSMSLSFKIFLTFSQTLVAHQKAVFSAKAFPITFQKAIHYPNNREKIQQKSLLLNLHFLPLIPKTHAAFLQVSLGNQYCKRIIIGILSSSQPRYKWGGVMSR